MNIKNKLNRFISLMLTIAMILTMVPNMALAVETGESDIPDANVFKFFRMISSDGTGTPIAKCDKEKPDDKATTNLIESATNLNKASVLLEFSLEYSQPVDIALYEYEGEQLEKMTFMYNDDPDIKEDFLGEKIGYIKGVRIEDNVDKSDPEKYAYNKIPAEEMNRLLDEYRKKLNTNSIPMRNELFYGYTGLFQPMPFNELLEQQPMQYNIAEATTQTSINTYDISKPTTSTSIIFEGEIIDSEIRYEEMLKEQLVQSENQTTDFIHNIILWDGSLTDEDGNDIAYEYERGIYVIVIEPILEKNRHFNSFLAFFVNNKMVVAYLSKAEHIGLYGCFIEDPVDLIDGSFTWDYTDIALNGRNNLELSRHYSSKYYENDYGFGKGWTTNFTYKVDEEPLYSRVTMPNGDSIYFNMDFDGTYNSSGGSPFTFEKTGSGYLMMNKDGTAYSFNSDGNIKKIENLNGESYILTYTGDKLSTVTNPAGEFTFTWSGDHISAVTDSTGRTITYTYDGDNLEKSVNPDGDSLIYAYTPEGFMTSITDFNGTKYIENTYDDQARVITQYVKEQGTSHFTYDILARKNTVTRENGYELYIIYDELGRIIEETDSYGTKLIEYNELHQKVSETDKNGNKTTYQHDDRGNISEIKYPDGSLEKFSYNSKNQLISHTDGEGAQTTYEYDTNGNISTATDGNGNTKYFEYDENNNLISSTDALGNTTTYTYDGAGNRTSATDALGNTTTYTYDEIGRILSQTLPDGATTYYEYTSAGKLVKVTDPEGNVKEYTVDGNGYTLNESDFMGNNVNFIYNSQNQVTSYTDMMGSVTTYSYDRDGRLVSETNSLGNTVSYVYDMKGRLTKITDARGNSMSYVYDSDGNITLTEDASGNISTVTYDSMGRVSAEKNNRGAKTSYSYDKTGRIVAITDHYGNSISYTYDGAGNLISETDRNGNVHTYTYDSESRLIETTDPEGNTRYFEYDANGRMVKSISAEGNTTTLHYDEVGLQTGETDARGNTTTYTYDILGRVVKITNTDGTETSYTYDDNGMILSATNEEGYSYRYEYDKNGNILSITDPMGGVTSYDYDIAGQLLSTTDAMGGITSYTYDANGNLKTSTDALGNMETYVYDELNRLISSTDAEGRTSFISYDESGNIISVTDKDGNITSYTYDMLDRLTSVTDPEGAAVYYEYDANGNMIKFMDAKGNETSYSYDGLNRQSGKINAEGNKYTVEYDKDGRIRKITDEEGAITTYTYDGNGNVTSVIDALGNSTTFTYDPMNRVTSVTDASGAVTTYAYTGNGLILSLTDAEGAITAYTYDKNGNMLSETNGENETTTYKYDVLNRLIGKTNPNNEAETFEYDAKGQITAVTDANGNRTQYVYDLGGNVVQTIDSLGNSSYFEYNASGMITRATLNRTDTQDNASEQQVTIYQYNGNNLITKTINAKGDEKIYVYDANGNLIQMTDEDGYLTEYSYNSLDLVTNINYNNGKNVSYAYNKTGQLVQMTDWNGVTTFETDLLKQITKVTDHKGCIVEYTYDAVGNTGSIKYPDNSLTTYEYDLNGRMTKVVEPESKTTEYSYDLAGRLKTMLYPNGWEEFYTYDPAGRMLEVKDTDPSDKTLKTIKHSYTYDAKGNILSEYKRGNGTGSAKEDLQYSYDELDRVIYAHENYGSKTRTYQYDSLGNLTYETGDNGSKFVDYKYNILNQLTNKTSDINNGEYHTYLYDNRGNLINEYYHKNNEVSVDGAYTYDELNRMSSGTNDIGETSSYVYNGLGYLVRNIWDIKKNAYGYHNVQPETIVEGEVVVDTSTGAKNKKEKKAAEEVFASETLNKKSTVIKDFLPDYTRGLQELLFETEEGGLTYRYGYGLNRMSVDISPVDSGAGVIAENGRIKMYYHQDYLGTTDYLTSDVTGRVASWTMYNEWGEITHNAVLKCGQRELDLVKNYTGHEYDQVIGQYYAKNRMYNPANRRFTQIDPIKDGYNWYAYVGNNPVNYIDPLGYKQLLPLSIIEKFGGTVTYRNEKDEFGDTIYKAVAVLGEKKETFYVYPNKKYYKGKSHCNEMYGSKMKVPVGEINALLGDAFIDTNQYRQVISILLGVNPLTGTYKDAQEALTGQDIITGKNLSGFERAFAVAAIINPFGGKEQVKIVADMGDDIFIELVFDVGKVADNPELADAFLDVVKKYGSNADYDELVDILKKYGAYADDLAEGAGKLSGKWTTVNESMSDASRAYQRQITGTDEVWLQNGVKYDGMSNGTLVEVKGSYANFVDKNTGTFKDWFTGQQGLIDQANRQLSASEGAAINWYFSDTASMNATKSLFSENRIKGINFIYQPIK